MFVRIVDSTEDASVRYASINVCGVRTWHEGLIIAEG